MCWVKYKNKKIIKQVMLRKKSLYFTLGIIIVSIIVLVTLLSTTYFYYLAKGRLVEDMKLNSSQSIASLSNNVANLVSAYAENEYINLITSELVNRHYFAIIVEDKNFAKILGREFYYNGIILDDNGKIIEFDQDNFNHQQKLKNAFYSDIKPLVNASNQVIGSISIYVSDESINKELREVILYTVINALIIALLLMASLFLTIRKYIVNPVTNIEEAVSNTDKDGVPVNYVFESGAAEINTLAARINEMITSIKVSRRALVENNKELKLREKLLSLLEAAINAAYDGIVVTDNQGTILWVNPAFTELTGFEANEVINQNMSVMRSGVQDAAFYKTLWQTIQSGQTWYGQIKNKRKNGEIYLEEESITPVIINNEIVNYVAIKRDITTQQQKEMLLQRSQRMYSLGKLTGGIAHDYNNMLGVIIGYCELLGMTVPDNNDVKDYLHAIIHAAERGSKLTKKLLSFTRRAPNEARPANINELVFEFRHMLEKMLTVRIEMNFNLQENLWDVYIDIDDLEDAMLNMSINAMHAMPDGGKLEFKTENYLVTAEEARTIGLEEGEYVKLSISDTGCGMDEEVEKHIFDPFFTTKDEMGTGLGLSQVYSFLERARGTITVSTSLGEGSVFELYFPRHISDAETSTQIITEQEYEKISGTASILVVDDEELLLNLSRDILKGAGYEVVCASSGEAALLILEKNADFDLMITDVIMPGIDGYQLARIVHEKYPSIRLLFISGYNQTQNSDIASDEHFQDLLRKPFSKRELLKTVDEVLQ
jgi:PAS domain S-box-containing protein